MSKTVQQNLYFHNNFFLFVFKCYFLNCFSFQQIDTQSLPPDGRTLLHVISACGGSTQIAQMLTEIRDTAAKDMVSNIL